MAEMDAAACLKRGTEYFNQDDFDRAIAEFTEAIRLDPNLAAAKSHLAVVYFNRGVMLFQEGNCERAIADLTESIRFNLDDATAYGARGTIYNSKGDYDGVIKDFTEVIRLGTDVAAPYSLRAGAYADKAKTYRTNGDKDNFFKYIDLSIEDYKASLNIDPDDIDVQKALEHLKNERELRRKVYEQV